MLLPYYANDLDRLPLEEMPWGVDYTELWPYDAVLSWPVGLAGIYAVLVAPLVAVATLVWVGFWWSVRGRSATWSSRVVTLLTVGISLGTIAWLMTSSLASTLVSWWLD
jgi:hypothetical protein